MFPRRKWSFCRDSSGQRGRTGGLRKDGKAREHKEGVDVAVAARSAGWAVLVAVRTNGVGLSGGDVQFPSFLPVYSVLFNHVSARTVHCITENGNIPTALVSYHLP